MIKGSGSILGVSAMSKIKTISFLLISLLVVNASASQSFLERLRVPIYVKPSLVIGYDTNMLRLSSTEMEETVLVDAALGDTETFDSEIIYPQIEFLYSPVISFEHETNIRISYGRAQYGQSNDKSYSSFSFRIEHHLGSYQWLKAGYSLQPDLYLRPYRDTDSISKLPNPCSFANETIFLSYSLPLARRVWVMVKGKRTSQYYVSNFTEFDTEVTAGYIRLGMKPLSWLQASIWWENGDGENTTFRDGFAATSLDRSYHHTRTGAKIEWTLKQRSMKVNFSIDHKNRRYKTESAEDPLHSGRSHDDFRYKLQLEKEFINGVVVKGDVRFRERVTDSEFDWVSELKSFRKTEFWLTFSYELVLDLFY